MNSVQCKKKSQIQTANEKISFSKTRETCTCNLPSMSAEHSGLAHETFRLHEATERFASV